MDSQHKADPPENLSEGIYELLEEDGMSRDLSPIFSGIGRENYEGLNTSKSSIES